MRPLPAAAALSALLLAGSAAGGESPGTAAAPFLQVPLGARAAGMGTAFSAVANDGTAIWYNPAGLARLPAHEAAFGAVSGAGETSLQHFSYAAPLAAAGIGGISGSGWASVGAGLVLSQSGTIEINRLNPNGTLASSRSVPAARDLAVSGAYAERAASVAWETREGSYTLDHYFGAGGKLVHSTLAEAYSASTLALDAGYLLHAPETGWSAGASIANAGGRLRYGSQADPLPSTARGGAAWQGEAGGGARLTAAVDGDYIAPEKRWGVSAGAECFWNKAYGMRAGYRFHRSDGGLSVGFGVRWKGRLLLDYAWSLGGDLGAEHRVSVAYRFGAVPAALRSKGRRRASGRAQVPNEEPGLILPERLREEAPRAPAPVPREGAPSEAPGWIY